MAWRPTRTQLALVGSVVAIWLIGLVWFRPWIAHNDFAIFRIALERELDGTVRVVGAHSRLDVFHPGPLREWVFALPYWISGRRAAALPATALALNVIWAIWTLARAQKMRLPAWGAACALGLLVLAIALGPDLMSPWNPHLAIVPMYLACWATVTVLGCRGEGWVACVVAASFAAQLHASVLILGGALLVIALISLLVQGLHVRAAGAFGLAVLLWSGPIIDLRNGSDANLIRLGTVGADGESVGLADALGHVSRLLWPGTPLGRVTVRPNVEEMWGFHRWWLLLVVVALIGVLTWSTRRLQESGAADDQPDAIGGEPAFTRTASAVALGVLVIAVVSVSLFVEPAFRYLYGPLQAAAVFVAAVVVGAVVAARFPVAAALTWFTRAVVPGTLVLVLLTVPRLDGASEERAELGVDAAVGEALRMRPSWRSVEAIPLDLRGAGDLDAEVLDAALRAGVDARSRRTELGLPAPVAVDGVFGVAMSPARDCLLEQPESDEIVRGETASGETFSVVVVGGDSAAFERCIGAPGP